MYRRRRITVAAVAVVVLLGGYTVIVGMTPLPALSTQLEISATEQFDADQAPAQQAADAQQGPTAVGWLDGEDVWDNDDDTYRIASISKVVTALVGLEAQPVTEGGTGDTYTVGDADVTLYNEVIAQNGTAEAVAPAGTELTQTELLQLMLLPSANNYAIAYARWIFGSDAAFAEAAADWLDRNGLDSIYIEEPSGLSDNNVGSAADVVRLSRLALDDPLVSSIVATKQADIPGIGVITNTNPLLGDTGGIGVKTGTTTPASYSLAGAKRVTVAGTERVAITAVLDRGSSDARAEDARSTLQAMKKSGQVLELVSAGERIGTVTTWQGETVELVAASDGAVEFAPGDSAEREAELTPVGAGAAGAEAGEVRITGPSGETSVQIVTGETIEAPGLWWRLTHPGKVFG